MRGLACLALMMLPWPVLAASSDMRWQYDGIRLVHGVPQTSEADFTASCATGKTVVTLRQAAPGLDVGGSIGIALAAGSFSGRYDGHGAMNDTLATVLPTLTLPSGDGLVDALAKGQRLQVTMDGVAAYEVPLQGSHGAVMRFAAACGWATSSTRRPRGK